MAALSTSLVIRYGNGLSAALGPHTPLRLSNMAWDFPERPDLIALTAVSERLDFLRDHLKSLCGLWDKLPRLFLELYFRALADGIARNRAALEALAAAHGGLFRPEDWSFAALCPLPHARLPTVPETSVDFAFWTGDRLHAVEIISIASQNRVRSESRARLQDGGISLTEIPSAELQSGQDADWVSRLPASFKDFWKTVPLPSSPFRIGAVDEILPT